MGTVRIEEVGCLCAYFITHAFCQMHALFVHLSLRKPSKGRQGTLPLGGGYPNDDQMMTHFS